MSERLLGNRTLKMRLPIYNYQLWLEEKQSVEGDTWYFNKDAIHKELKNNIHQVCCDLKSFDSDKVFPWDDNFKYGNPDSVPEGSCYSYEECKKTFDVVRDMVDGHISESPEDCEFWLEFFITKKNLEVDCYAD